MPALIERFVPAGKLASDAPEMLTPDSGTRSCKGSLARQRRLRGAGNSWVSSDFGTDGGYGAPTESAGGSWANFGTNHCGLTAHLHCLEQGCEPPRPFQMIVATMALQNSCGD